MSVNLCSDRHAYIHNNLVQHGKFLLIESCYFLIIFKIVADSCEEKLVSFNPPSFQLIIKINDFFWHNKNIFFLTSHA